MRSTALDLTAGKRAREIRESPEVAQQILDPTDSRWGGMLDDGDGYGRARPIFDPTDPQSGRPSV